MMKWEAESKGYTCNDCFLSMQNCRDKSICCEDETGLCDYFEEIPKAEEEGGADGTDQRKLASFLHSGAFDSYGNRKAGDSEMGLEEVKQMDDLISRADVEQTVEDNILCYTHSDRPIDQDPDTECHRAIRTALRMLRKDLRKLPSAQPKRGKWIERESGTEDMENGFETVIVCSCCDFPATTFYSEDCESRTQIRTDFCPNCGADMRGKADGRF